MTIVEHGIMPFTEKSQQKRVVQRRCPVCDRGHSCYATAADLDVQIMESPADIQIGSTHRLDQDVMGSWRGIKTPIPEATVVTVKNLHVETKTGLLRAMIELDNGDTQWIPARLLGPTIDK